MSRNRREAPEESSGYSWMDTYGDMVTLILCFFVMLYSFSSIDARKWQELVGAFTGSRDVSVELIDTKTVRQREVSVEGIDRTVKREEDTQAQNVVPDDKTEAFDDLYYNIKLYIEEKDLDALLSVQKEKDVILLRFKEAILFHSGEAYILEEGKPVLDHIINVISQNIDAVDMIRIEGHTDNVPIHNAMFNSNWELSMARASSALRYFINSGKISLDKLSAVAYGEYQPVESNDTPEGRACNRRVDFVIEKADSAEAPVGGIGD